MTDEDFWAYLDGKSEWGLDTYPESYLYNTIRGIREDTAPYDPEYSYENNFDRNYALALEWYLQNAPRRIFPMEGQLDNLGSNGARAAWHRNPGGGSQLTYDTDLVQQGASGNGIFLEFPMLERHELGYHALADLLQMKGYLPQDSNREHQPAYLDQLEWLIDQREDPLTAREDAWVERDIGHARRELNSLYGRDPETNEYGLNPGELSRIELNEAIERYIAAAYDTEPSAREIYDLRGGTKK